MSFKKLVDAQLLSEKSPKGWEGTVKALKKHGDEVDNPWALAHWMKNQGYKSHKKASGADKESIGEDEHLTQNVVDGVVRHIMMNYPHIIQQHGQDTVKQVAYENTSWLTDDWPEDEGFGSSDSYGPVKGTLKHFGIDHDAELRQRHARESIRVNHPVHGNGTVEEIAEAYIEITWDNLEKRVSAPNRIAFSEAKYLTRLSEQYSSDPDDVEVDGGDEKDDMKKHSRNNKGKKSVKENINETTVAIGMAAIGGTHRGTQTASVPTDDILRFDDLLENDDEWNKPWEDDDSDDSDDSTTDNDSGDGDLRSLDKNDSKGADYTNVPRPADSILTNQEDQPKYKADPLATMAGYDAAGSGDEPEGDYGTDLNPTDAPDVPDVRELEGTDDRHNTRNTGDDNDDTSEVDSGDYDETKPEDGEDKMKNESLWLDAEDLGLDLTEMEHGASMTGYGEDEGMNEHDMGAGEIAFTREFLDKLLAAVSEQAPDADKVAALCSGLEAAQQEKGDVGLDVSDWDSIKSHAASAYEGGGEEGGENGDEEGGDYEGGDAEPDAEMSPPDDMEADDEAYFEKGGDNDDGYWNEEDRAAGDGEEAGPEGGEEHEGKTKMMDRKGSYDKDTGHRVRGQNRPAGKDMRRRKPQKSKQYEGDGSSGTPVGTGNTSGSGGGGQKDLSAPKKYSGKPVGTGTSGAGGSSSDEFGQKPSKDGGSNLLPAVNSGKQLGAASTNFGSDAESPAPRSSKPLAAESKRKGKGKSKIDEAIMLGMAAIPGVYRGGNPEVPSDADWDDELKTIKRLAGMDNWWKD